MEFASSVHQITSGHSLETVAWILVGFLSIMGFSFFLVYLIVALWAKKNLHKAGNNTDKGRRNKLLLK